MDKKNLMSQAAQPVDNLSIEDLPIELAELSEEVLSEVRGGWINPDIIIGPVKVFPPKIELCCFCRNPPQIPISSQSVKIDASAFNK
jgi:bacteriocin leader peptide (microcyclamide/patellamide family)